MRAEREIHITPRERRGHPPGEAYGPVSRAKDEASSLGVLFRQLGEDASVLVREEVALAKLELRREARAVGSDLAQVGAALFLLLLGAMAFTAFLILVVGLLVGAFWAGALIVSAILLIGGGLWARSAVQDLKERSMAPEATISTLRDDARWGKHESEEFKREVTP